MLLLASFVVIESRSTAPLVRLSIFRIRSLATANAVMLLVASGDVRDVLLRLALRAGLLGYSPLKAGFAFLPVTLGIVVGAGIAQQLISRVGVRNVAVVGIALAAAGMLILTRRAGPRHYVRTCSSAWCRCRSGWG